MENYSLYFQGYCYIWSESEGRKGSQGISTCLDKFINEEVPSGIETLNFFVDNCAGHNKNSIVVAMLGISFHEHPTL
ncbi:Protein of unknown function [Cotesia congregata]|uniref:Uncharacterized protein n=1 Tax=Cotesia congregata TaxID=51543 RepID=A0A8J2E2T5_COTCN|nr:Protein of unknown function [Cotesia congregata]